MLSSGQQQGLGPRLITALLLAGFVLALFSVPLRDVDEALYAEIAREMVYSGDWVDTRLNEGRWYQQPPLVMWTQAGCMSMLGVNRVSARLPSLVAVLLTAFALAWYQRRRSGSGWLVAVIWLAMPATHLMVRDAKLDAMLTACIALAVLATEIRRPLWRLTGLTLALAAGVLTKNLVGLAWPLAVVVAVELLRAHNESRRPRWREFFWWVGAAVLAVAIALPWGWAMYTEHGPHFIETLFGRQLMARFASKQLTDASGPWFFALVLAWSAAPFVWMLALPVGRALGQMLRRPRLHGEALLPAVAVGIPLIVMSLSRSKLPHYIFPVLPFIAIAASSHVEKWKTLPSRDRAISRLVLMATPVSVAGYVIAHMLLYLDPTLAGALIALAVLPLIALSVSQRKKTEPHALVWIAVASLALLNLYFSASVYPQQRAFEPAVEIAAELQRQRAPLSRKILAYKLNTRSAVAFAAGRPVVEVNARSLRTQLTRDPGAHALLVLDHDLDQLDTSQLQIHEIQRYPWARTSRSEPDFWLRWRRERGHPWLYLLRVELAPDSLSGDHVHTP